jgi:hypothetical protein
MPDWPPHREGRRAGALRCRAGRRGGHAPAAPPCAKRGGLATGCATAQGREEGGIGAGRREGRRPPAEPPCLEVWVDES